VFFYEKGAYSFVASTIFDQKKISKTYLCCGVSHSPVPFHHWQGSLIMSPLKIKIKSGKETTKKQTPFAAVFLFCLCCVFSSLFALLKFR